MSKQTSLITLAHWAGNVRLNQTCWTQGVGRRAAEQMEVEAHRCLRLTRPADIDYGRAYVATIQGARAARAANTLDYMSLPGEGISGTANVARHHARMAAHWALRAVGLRTL